MKWEKVELNSICDLENGYAFKSKDYIEESNVLICRMSNIRPEGGFNILYNPKYAPENFKELHSKYLLVDGDIIIAMTDMATDPKILGVPTIVRTNGFSLLLNQRVGKLVIRNKEEIHVPYLQYVLNRPQVKSYYKKFAGGGVQINIGKKQILGVKIPLPPLPTQKAIAELLDTADSLRRTTAEQLQQLDKLAESVFLEMFGDPVKNEKGWEVKTIEDLVRKEKYSIKRGPFGGALKKEFFVEDGYLVYEQYHALNNDFSMARYFIDDFKFNELKAFEVKADDIIISCSGVNLGRLAVVPKNARKGIINQALLKLTLDKNKMNNTLFLYIFRNKNFISANFANNRGSGVPNFPPMSVFKKFNFITPPIHLQNEFAKIIANIEEQKAALKESLVDSEDMFNGLLQEIFS